MIKYILFDLDGTLTDSAPGIINSLKYALDKLGVGECDRKILEKFIGPPLAESFSRFFGFEGEENANAIRVYREYFSEKGLFENSVYPGIAEMLDHLISKGMTLAVATSKPEVFAKKILEKFGLSDRFAIICGIPLDNEKMTKAQVIERTMRELEISDKTESVMVGDRDYDVFGAASNGILCIGAAYGYGSKEELSDAGAKWLLDSPFDLDFWNDIIK